MRQLQFACEIPCYGKSLISIFQQFIASIGKSFILWEWLGTRSQIYEVLRIFRIFGNFLRSSILSCFATHEATPLYNIIIYSAIELLTGEITGIRASLSDMKNDIMQALHEGNIRLKSRIKSSWGPIWKSQENRSM